MNHSNVAVLRGGPSAEYDVSMRTGKSVIEALSDSSFNVQDVVISKNGEWIIDGFVRDPGLALATTDVAFIALHGAYGEDGTVQRILERLAIPFTGSNSFASHVALNKLLTKEHLRQFGIKMPRHLKVTRHNPDLTRVVYGLSELFGPDYVVKPVAGGSSIDTHIVTGAGEVLRIVRQLLEHYEDVLVEERIHGREATVGVVERMRDTPLYALPAVEIVPPESANFFDYENKYNGRTDEICPGRFSSEEKAKLENLAKQVHSVLQLSQYSRSDFIVAEDGIYFLEVNTLPGLTKESLLPKALEAVGCEYKDFLVHLLTDHPGLPR